MDWRDLLYFSKGERRALTLLLCLITVSWILLLQTDKKRMLIEAQTENRQASGERQIIIGKDTSGQQTESVGKESEPHPNKTKNTPNESELRMPKNRTPAETNQAAFLRVIWNSSWI